MSDIKVGFSTDNLKSGPKVFLGRLRQKLAERNQFDEENCQVWLQAVFGLPDRVRERRSKGEVKTVLRSDGAYCIDFTPHIFGTKVPLLKPLISNPLNYFFNRHIRKNISDSDAIIYQSHFSWECITFHVKKVNLPHTTISNAVDLEFFHPAENRSIEPAAYPKILVSHRMHPFKRGHDIPELIFRLKKVYPNIQVHLCGGAVKNVLVDTWPSISSKIEEFGLQENFVLHGVIKDQKELRSVYQQCDFMLSLSYADPYPNSVVEAVACGLPVVAPQTGGIKEVACEAGIYVKECLDPHVQYWHVNSAPKPPFEEYVKAVEFLLDQLGDYQDKAREVAQTNNDMDVVCTKYYEFLSSVAKGGV